MLKHNEHAKLVHFNLVCLPVPLPICVCKTCPMQSNPQALAGTLIVHGKLASNLNKKKERKKG